MVRTADEIAEHFDAEVPVEISVPTETTEGTQGPIVIEINGRRVLKSLSWGFPRQTKEMRLSGEPGSEQDQCEIARLGGKVMPETDIRSLKCALIGFHPKKVMFQHRP